MFNSQKRYFLHVLLLTQIKGGINTQDHTSKMEVQDIGVREKSTIGPHYLMVPESRVAQINIQTDDQLRCDAREETDNGTRHTLRTGFRTATQTLDSLMRENCEPLGTSRLKVVEFLSCVELQKISYVDFLVPAHIFH